MYNKVVLIGNCVNDAELRTVGKTTLARFRLAVNDPLREKNPLFIECEAWADQADFCEKWVTKGKGLIVDGRLCMDSWESDGKKQSKIFVKVSDIKFSSPPQNSGKPEKKQTESKQRSETKPQQKSTQNLEEEEDSYSEVPF
jgi:single-strand DNA-binding protein